MAGVKRKASEGVRAQKVETTKKLKPSKGAVQPPSKPILTAKRIDDADNDSGSEEGYEGQGNADSEVENLGETFAGLEDDATSKRVKALAAKDKVANKKDYKDSNGHMTTSSKEAHAKQRALAKERKAAKPNADSIARSKKIWEKLRRKSHVSPEERKELVAELFSIISGRVKEFVFKHDSVRVIQCALKYANMAQRKQIAKELQGEFKTLAESKYAKFLIAKLVVEGDKEIQQMIVKEFYGHVKRSINHPEASWILDDIYRQVATKEQKATLLREWYGAEFAIFKTANASGSTANLADILKETPEKRKPILQHLYNLINQLLQKKLTGFTMLHDAMLQYYLNCKPGSEEATEFLELLKGQGDEEEKDNDILKNLAFTASGSNVVCMALAYGTAKDRRYLLKVYKDMIELLAHDAHGHRVILTAYDVVDDTVGTFKAFFPELIGGKDPDKQRESILELSNHAFGRATLLYPFALATSSSIEFPKWLLNATDISLLTQMHEIRETTSKKDTKQRRQELVRSISPPLLQAVSTEASTLSQTSYGCQFIAEIILAADGDKAEALKAVAELVSGDPTSDEGHLVHVPSQSRMIKTLIQGGHFDNREKKVHRVMDSSAFCEAVYDAMSDKASWATSQGVFIVVALVEQPSWKSRATLVRHLQSLVSKIKQEVVKVEREMKKAKDQEKGSGARLAGMNLLLEKLA